MRSKRVAVARDAGTKVACLSPSDYRSRVPRPDRSLAKRRGAFGLSAKPATSDLVGAAGEIRWCAEDVPKPIVVVLHKLGPEARANSQPPQNWREIRRDRPRLVVAQDPAAGVQEFEVIVEGDWQDSLVRRSA